MCGEHSPCSGQAARSFGGFSPGAACLFPPRQAARAARGLCALSPGPGAPFPSAASGPGGQRLGALSMGVVCLFPPRRAARVARGLAPSPLARCAFSLHGEWLRQPDAWHPLPWRGAPFPSTAPAHAAGQSQEVFRQEPLPVCNVGGGGFSGAEFDPFPSPRLLPPAGMGQLFSGVSQSLCFVNRRQCVPAG